VHVERYGVRGWECGKEVREQRERSVREREEDVLGHRYSASSLSMALRRREKQMYHKHSATKDQR
jgi:hypothetical protein